MAGRVAGLGFTQKPEVVEVGSHFLRIASFNFVASGLIFTCSGIFQGLGHTWPALAATASRIVTFMLPAIWLSTMADYRIEQVWYLSARERVDAGGDQLRPAAADDEGATAVRKATKKASAAVSAPLLTIDRRDGLHLQDQIRQRIVECVTLGSLAPTQKLPSTRSLARQLKVSRNTVAAAYQKLVADGHLEARPRSGIYVSNARSAAIRRAGLRAAGEPTPVESQAWLRQLGSSRQVEDLLSVPPDWQQFPFPFVGSQLDRSLFPVAEWREASRLTLSLPEIDDWAADAANADDPKLVQEIRSKVLPRRGIHARADEVLVTTDGQQALHLTVELLVERGTTVAVEEPGNPELVALLRRRGAEIIFQPVDHEGLVVDDRIARCGVVYVSPGHQRPTGVAALAGTPIGAHGHGCRA